MKGTEASVTALPPPPSPPLHSHILWEWVVFHFSLFTHFLYTNTFHFISVFFVLLNGRSVSFSFYTCSQWNSVYLVIFPFFPLFYHTIHFCSFHSDCFTLVSYSDLVSVPDPSIWDMFKALSSALSPYFHLRWKCVFNCLPYMHSSQVSL